MFQLVDVPGLWMYFVVVGLRGHDKWNSVPGNPVTFGNVNITAIEILYKIVAHVRIYIDPIQNQ